MLTAYDTPSASPPGLKEAIFWPKATGTEKQELEIQFQPIDHDCIFEKREAKEGMWKRLTNAQQGRCSGWVSQPHVRVRDRENLRALSKRSEAHAKPTARSK